jgi:hypothetical protein
MNSNDKFTSDDGDAPTNGYRYSSLISGLIYVTHTRPDITFAVEILSRFMQEPLVVHYGVAKRILRYLVGTNTKVPSWNFRLWVMVQQKE